MMTFSDEPGGPVRRLLHDERAAALALVAAAALALVAANSPLAATYHAGLRHRIGPLTFLHWVDDGLMTLFFLLVGLEVKREIVGGRLARWRDRALPGIVAAAGMAGPALVYLAIAGGRPGLAAGWAIPAATDIAFAIGVVALLGRRVPASLKLLLTTIAIVDDLGAVAIIALVYGGALHGGALLAALMPLAVMTVLNRTGVARLAPYLACGGVLWLAVLQSGLHATVAGVLTAAFIPARASVAGAAPPLDRLEHRLRPWVAFGILPVFAFANAGVTVDGAAIARLLTPLPLGIAAGLFVGKQGAIGATLWLGAASGLAGKPDGASWRQVHGMALLCGIGFTMSLFIGGLAFPHAPLAGEVKLGVIAGSILSAIGGYAALRWAPDARENGGRTRART